MSNPKCFVCGHVNRVGAEICEMCDARLGVAAAADGEPSGAPRSSHAPGEGPRAGALPTDIPLPQFKGAGDVISPTLAVFRKNFLLVLALVVVTALPTIALQVGAGMLMALFTANADAVIASGEMAWPMAFAAGAGLLAFLMGLLAYAFLTGSLSYGVVELQRTGAAKVGDCLRWGLKRLPKVFAVVIVNTIVVWVGFLFLIVPGVIFSLMFAVATPVAAIENRGVIESLKRSADLTRGYKGLIFLTLFLWTLLIIVVTLIVTGSFAFGGGGEVETTTSLIFQELVGQLLQSTSIVLTIFIYLGLLNEHEQGFETRAFTPAPEAAGEATR